jgi:hypothetical protein
MIWDPARAMSFHENIYNKIRAKESVVEDLGDGWADTVEAPVPTAVKLTISGGEGSRDRNAFSAPG